MELAVVSNILYFEHIMLAILMDQIITEQELCLMILES